MLAVCGVQFGVEGGMYKDGINLVLIVCRL
jgi:hypothetical protein